MKRPLKYLKQDYVDSGRVAVDSKTTRVLDGPSHYVTPPWILINAAAHAGFIIFGVLKIQLQRGK